MTKEALVLILLELLHPHITTAMDLPAIKHTVSGDYLTTLYKGDSKSYFYIREIKDINPDKTFLFLKELLNNNGFRTVKWCPYQLDWSDPNWVGKDWSDQDWQKNQYRLIHGVENKEKADLIKDAETQLSGYKGGDLNLNLLHILMNHRRYEDSKCSLDELSARLAHAKNVIKSFVPFDDGKIYSQENFIKKGRTLNRLFTYAKLQQIMAEKQLTRVRLPLKVLRIKNAQTKEYVSAEDALEVIDNGLKVFLYDDFTFSIEFMSREYQIEIVAAKEKKEGKGLSKAAMEELIMLCKEAPFDIGHDNIFWDAFGNAIVIDTEFKDASVHDCSKLARYPIDSALL